ncbi:MAG TPA: flagellar protein FlhE [Oleiagrimonas sp.]|nr:flagellar protein FlhE [Oleiagrimonas sp.]
MKWWLLLSVLALWPATSLAGAGSWSATVDGPRVAGVGRAYVSKALVPPGPIDAAHVVRVRWRYTAPSGPGLLAWLCTGNYCVRLHAHRGVTDAFAGTPGGAHWRFRFRLETVDDGAINVGPVQLLVDYR